MTSGVILWTKDCWILFYCLRWFCFCLFVFLVFQTCDTHEDDLRLEQTCQNMGCRVPFTFLGVVEGGKFIFGLTPVF